MRGLLVAVALLLALPAPLGAHPAPFSYLDLRLDDTGGHGSLLVHDLDVAHDLGIERPETLQDPEVSSKYRDQLVRLLDRRLTLLLDGQRTTISWGALEPVAERQSLRLLFRLQGPRPASLHVDTVMFPYDPVHQTFVNVYEDGTLRHQTILDYNRSTFDYYAGSLQGTWAVIGTFVPAGIEHILIGPDHILFLIGLLLLGGSLWRLAGIVTAFTVGHSITLSLAALDIVSPPASIVEPTIALSIVFVGADNLLVGTRRHRESFSQDEDGKNLPMSSSPRDIRAWVAGVFGLVHGFGFASVLKEFGLPSTALGWSLFSFNLGVEVGQLFVVLVVASALAAVRRRSARLGERLALAGSVIVIIAGGYWFIERVLQFSERVS